jgi:hypothetical protein
MKPTSHDEIADRTAEERSEDDGMPEHPAKARDPERWAAERHARTGRRAPERRRPGRADMAGIAMVSCAVLAALALARGVFRRLGAGTRAVTPQARLPR